MIRPLARSTSRSRERAGATCVLIAAVMLLAGLPTVGALVIVPTPQGPTLEVNVCHPLRSFDRASDAGTIARPAAPTMRLEISPSGDALTCRAAAFPEVVIVPDTPPPRRFV